MYNSEFDGNILEYIGYFLLMCISTTENTHFLIRK